MKTFVTVAAAFVLLAGAASSVSAAEDATCGDGETLPPGTYGDVTISGACSLDEAHVIEGDLTLVGSFEGNVIGTSIHGNLILDGGGSTGLIDIEVGGDVVALGAYSFALSASRIEGDVIAGRDARMIYMEVSHTQVGGSILLDSPSGDGVALIGNTVGRDVDLYQTGIQTIVDDNQIGRNLSIVGSGGWHPSSVQRNDVSGQVLISDFLVITETYTPLEVLVIADNSFRKNVRILDSSGPIYLTDNQVGGVLQCRGNQAFFPEANTAKNMIGQCRE